MTHVDSATTSSESREHATPARTRLSRTQRRSQIVHSARDVFLELGTGARIRDIADAAGVNDALLYQHFRSKTELFEAAVVEPLHQAAAKLVDNANELPLDVAGGVHYEATKDFLRDLLAVLCESARLLSIVLSSDRSSGDAFYQAQIAPVLDVMVSVVEYNLESWSHRDFDPDIVTKAAFGMCWGLAIDHAFGEADFEPEQVAEQLTSMMFFGLMTEGRRAT